MKYIKIEDFERDLFERFSKISVGPGLTFDGQAMSKARQSTKPFRLASLQGPRVLTLPLSWKGLEVWKTVRSVISSLQSSAHLKL